MSLPRKIRVALKQADAAVPTENGVVIARRAELFGLGEASQGSLKQGSERVSGAPGVELRFQAALVQQAGVVVALVRVAQRGEKGFDFRVAVGGVAGELVGDGETQRPPGELMIRFHGKNVAADGFGFFGFVQIPIELGFGDSFGYVGFGNFL